MGKRKTTAILTGTTLLSIAIGVGIGYFVFGNPSVADKTAGTSENMTTVCDSGVVSRYNDATVYKIRDENAQPSLDSAALKALADEVKTKDGYESDATCQAIVFWNAIEVSDYDTAKSAKDAITRLHGQGTFIDNNMRITVALFEYGSVVDAISPNKDETEGAGAGGL